MFSPPSAASRGNHRPIDSVFSEQEDTSLESPSPQSLDASAPERILQNTDPVRSDRHTDIIEPEATVRDPDSTVYERDQKITTTRFHIIQKDETLSAISQQYYGTANQWRKILAANEQSIKDANKIRPGTKLIIPE